MSLTTAQESSTGRFANQMMLLDIDPPDAERIKSLQSFEKGKSF